MRNLRKFVMLAAAGGILLQLGCFTPLLFSLGEGFLVSLLTSLLFGAVTPPVN